MLNALTEGAGQPPVVTLTSCGIVIMLVGIRAAVLLLLLLLAQYASGQVTSIFLSYHGQQTEQARVLVFDLVTP